MGNGNGLGSKLQESPKTRGAAGLPLQERGSPQPQRDTALTGDSTGAARVSGAGLQPLTNSLPSVSPLAPSCSRRPGVHLQTCLTHLYRPNFFPVGPGHRRRHPLTRGCLVPLPAHPGIRTTLTSKERKAACAQLSPGCCEEAPSAYSRSPGTVRTTLVFPTFCCL